ncbi:MAG: hypothetical protein QM754_02610 [Tepidisphaeraceae bacterium]
MRFSKETKTGLAALAALLLAADSAVAGYYTYSVNTSTPSRNAPVRRELMAAQRDLAKATAAAQAGASAEPVKAAQAALGKARQDYAAALKEARKSLATDPTVGPLQKAVQEIEARLAAQSEPYARMNISSELLTARNALNDAEWDHLGIDPDLAIRRADIDDAANALKQAQADQQSAIRQDPAVAAAQQRVLALRMQLSRR